MRWWSKTLKRVVGQCCGGGTLTCHRPQSQEGNEPETVTATNAGKALKVKTLGTAAV